MIYMYTNNPLARTLLNLNFNIILAKFPLMVLSEVVNRPNIYYPKLEASTNVHSSNHNKNTQYRRQLNIFLH